MRTICQITNLSKSFGKHEVLNDVTLTLEPKIYGLLGANGAGKTTLLRCICGLYHSRENQVVFEDNTHIGYLPQTFGAFCEFTVIEMMKFFSLYYYPDRKIAEEELIEQLSQLHLKEKAREKVKTLSGGMLRRLGLAQALIGGPDMVVLDEPTSGLDPEERRNIKNVLALKSENRLILLSTHIVSDVDELCEEVIVMEAGEILFVGTKEELRCLAQGHVYEMSEKECEELHLEESISQTMATNEKINVRVVTSRVLDYPVVEPTLEEAYLCVVRHIGKSSDIK